MFSHAHKGVGLVGLLLSVGFLFFFMYIVMQYFYGSSTGDASKYEEGVTAIEEAKAVKDLVEGRYE